MTMADEYPKDPTDREEALQTLAAFVKTAPGRLPFRVQEALRIAGEDLLPGGRAPSTREEPGLEIMNAVCAEVVAARRKYPGNSHLLAALLEEAGEVSRAFLQDEGKDRVREEAIQVAAMAIRIAEEGDQDFERGGNPPKRVSDLTELMNVNDRFLKLPCMIKVASVGKTYSLVDKVPMLIVDGVSVVRALSDERVWWALDKSDPFNIE